MVDRDVRRGVGVKVRWFRWVVVVIPWRWWSELWAMWKSARRTTGMSVRRAMWGLRAVRRTISFAVARTVKIPSRRRRSIVSHAIGARWAIHHAIAKVTPISGTSSIVI
ncbi:hypothetical protein ACHAXS_010038, partial [Conticribra weissflogii]